VSGNVSLYNETQGRGILPTPTIGGVGVVDDVSKSATLAFRDEGEAVILIGETRGWLGSSVYLWLIENREEGAPPPVDLAAEKKNGDFVREQILKGAVSAVHDLSDGGLAVALAEMAMAGGVGAKVDQLPAGPAHAVLFGEDQARYLVATKNADALLAAAKSAGVPALRLGTTGGAALTLSAAESISVADLKTAHEGWFPAYMAGSKGN
jgi:phosphoribosylformylglycinamidine synthase